MALRPQEEDYMSPGTGGGQSRNGLLTITFDEEDFRLSIFTILCSAGFEVMVPKEDGLLSANTSKNFFQTAILKYH